MLERIREGSQGVVAKTILGLVILTFALSGVYSYIGTSSTPAAATVNGVEISQQNFQRVYENERARMESQMGELFSQLASSAEYLDNFRSNILDRLIAEELTSQSSDELGIRVSDQQIKDAVRNMPEFQLDGAFNNERYLAILRQAGFTSNGFRDYMREEMSRRQLTSALVLSEFALDSEAVAFNQLQNQERSLRYLEIKSNDFRDKVELTDDQVQQYYQSNLSQFDTQEKVALEYIRLSSADLAAGVSVAEEEIQQYYDDNISNYQQAEQRRASHILVEFGDDEVAAEAQAQSLLTQLESGADFAELAQSSSADSFSAENGGDLDWFERGIMDAAFDDATFAIAEVNGLSGVVKSAFGFHIIKLTGIQPEQTKPLSEVLDEITASLKQLRASELFYEARQTLSELAFEVPDSLLDAAEAIGEEVAETELFDRFSVPQEFDNPQLVEQAFSSDLIEQQINSDVIELGNEDVIVIRVAQHQPVRTQSLEEVNDQVTEALLLEQSRALAKSAAEQWSTAIAASESLDAKLAEQQLSWVEKPELSRNDTTVDRRLLSKAFTLAAPTDAAKTVEVVEIADGFAVVELLEVKQGEEGAPTERDAVKQRLASGASQRLLEQFVEALKETADIQKS
jgi:peptidyl-prolyl cis-trans isomerase D